MPVPAFVAGYIFSRRAAMAFISLRTCSSVTPSFSRPQAVERQLLERINVEPPIDVIRQRDRHICSGGGFIKINEALRLRIWEGTEEDSVNDTEDGAVRTDAEREGKHCDNGEPG